MVVRDEKKCSELLEGLKAEKVTVSNLSEYFGKQCLFVNVHQKNWADKKVSISDVLIQNNVSEETLEFFSKYKNRTLISIFPNDKMKKINSIFASIRAKRNACSFGRDGLMTADLYKESFKPFFDEKKEELADTIEELKAGYDTYVEAFKSGFEKMLNDVKVEETQIENITNSVYAQIPKKVGLENQFDINLELKAYPILTSISILDEEISEDVKASISDTAIQAAYDIIGTNLSVAFKQVNDLLKYYQRAFKFKDSDRKRIQILSARLAKDNLLKNAMVSEIADNMKELAKPTYSDDDLAEELEESLAKIYKFASETETVDALELKDCILDETTLKMYV